MAKIAAKYEKNFPRLQNPLGVLGMEKKRRQMVSRMSFSHRFLGRKVNKKSRQFFKFNQPAFGAFFWRIAAVKLRPSPFGKQ